MVTNFSLDLHKITMSALTPEMLALSNSSKQVSVLDGHPYEDDRLIYLDLLLIPWHSQKPDRYWPVVRKN